MPSGRCEHLRLQTEPSKWAEWAGYRRAAPAHRVAAATSHGQVKHVQVEDPELESSRFPAPLVLPGDDLAGDPAYPKQSFRSWLREKERNAVTEARNVIYIAPAPGVASSVDFIRTWTTPRCAKTTTSDDLSGRIIEYLTACFHGLPVKRLGQNLQFVAWEEFSNRKRPAYVGLKTSNECIGIRTRSCPDEAFQRQLNVNDLIDAVISVLPQDAYALMLIVNHDIYEDEEDDFMCGRAYGGSRAAVVSTARYNPCFDAAIMHLDVHHAWPASHCQSYVEKQLVELGKMPQNRLMKRTVTIDLTEETPLHRAIEAYRKCFDEQPQSQAANHNDVWLSRVCRTASHELGHCFGMDHCVYYACNMQGTAGMAEDIRQPPYLCPVCLAKILHATGTTDEARYSALLAYCEKMAHVAMFAAYGAWIRGLREEIERRNSAQ